MITQLVWTTWTPMSAVPKKTAKLNNSLISVALLPRCLSNCRAIGKVYTQILRLQDFTRSSSKTSVRFVNGGPRLYSLKRRCLTCIEISIINLRWSNNHLKDAALVNKVPVSWTWLIAWMCEICLFLWQYFFMNVWKRSQDLYQTTAAFLIYIIWLVNLAFSGAMHWLYMFSDVYVCENIFFLYLEVLACLHGPWLNWKWTLALWGICSFDWGSNACEVFCWTHWPLGDFNDILDE